MDWITETPERLSLVLGLTAVLGGLIGATVGAVVNYHNTSRQIARQERDARRDIYSDFLAAYLAFRQHQRKQNHLEQSHAETMKAAYEYRAEKIQAEDREDLETAQEIEKAVVLFTGRADRLAAQYEAQLEQFDEVFNRFLVMNHRVKIGAPIEIFEAATLIYNVNGLLMQQEADTENEQVVSDWADRSLKAFSALSRSDVRAPGAPSFREAVRREWASMVELSVLVAPEVAGYEPLRPRS